ncbi:MAG: isopentenyl-diphosphate delta-isomerase [Flavobacteriaceae bacterium]|jgi:isopentenyl-diphosphate delta-isomerase
MEKVILVDENDHPLGEMEKMEAHSKGLLHRVFSIFIFNENNELMLQRRALRKYHSGGLWTNSCCSHQGMGETTLAAGYRRLTEELNFTTELSVYFSFIYRAELGGGMIENELDHLLIGHYNDHPTPNQEEVDDVKFLSLKTIEEDIVINPDDYTAWFKVIFNRVNNSILSEKRQS